eukprot:692188-Rhodomonas_salina.2
MALPGFGGQTPGMGATPGYRMGMTPGALAISLRACYAMPGTCLAYGGICVRTCYAMPGAGLAYGDS